MLLTLIGDVHGKLTQYKALCHHSEVMGWQTLQLGDMAFSYGALNGLDPDKHKFIHGNHDNPQLAAECSNFLGRYGVHPHFQDLFYVSGGYSLDWQSRTKYVHWFPEEQLSYSELMKAQAQYLKVKPRIMVTHECPRSIADEIGDPSFLAAFGLNPKTFSTLTSEALDEMWQKHRPELWVFGHFHKSWTSSRDGTTFACLDELETLDLSSVFP